MWIGKKQSGLQFANSEITPAYILNIIQTVLSKYAKKKRYIISAADNLNFYSVQQAQHSLSKAIYKDLLQETYQPSPVHEYQATIMGKARVLTKFTFIDTIVLHTFAKILNTYAQNKWCPNLYSYIKNLSS